MSLADQTVRVMSAAIAPVFLISGIGVILNSMTLRYGRVIDRVRDILDSSASWKQSANASIVIEELSVLYKRAKQLRATIIMAATSIFLISLTIGILFAELLMDFHVPFATETLFMLSITFMSLSVALFIQDFALSMETMKREIKEHLQAKIETPPSL